MQSDGGSTFIGNSASDSDQQASITQMVIDGTQGTADGDGLVQCINQYGNIYEVSILDQKNYKKQQCQLLICTGRSMLQLRISG
jgi:hypothetical protein